MNQLQKSSGCSSWATVVLNGFSFRGFVEVHSDDFETQFPVQGVWRISEQNAQA
jgi:hypothetical protein